jgi:hypothetical protein
MMRSHHDVLMRTTVDLPDDLHRIALGLSRDTGRSLSQTVVFLMRRGLSAPEHVSEPAPAYTTDPDTGLPQVRSHRPVTSEDVRSLEDEV